MIIQKEEYLMMAICCQILRSFEPTIFLFFVVWNIMAHNMLAVADTIFCDNEYIHNTIFKVIWKREVNYFKTFAVCIS